MHQFHLKLSSSIIVALITITCCSTINNNYKTVKHLSLNNETWPTNSQLFDHKNKKIELETKQKSPQNYEYKDTTTSLERIKTSTDQKTVQEWYDVFVRNNTIVGRTFGGIRRLKLAIPAIMYKLGVVTTMLGVLAFLSLKGVIIGIIILIIQLSAAFSKLHSSKKEHGWEPENSWPNKVPQNIHVHVHGTGQHHSGHYSYSPPHQSHSSSIWDRDLHVGSSNLNPNGGNSNMNLYASLTPYSAYNNYKNSNSVLNSKLDDDLLIKLREYKELKELRELRDSLYQQVI